MPKLSELSGSITLVCSTCKKEETVYFGPGALTYNKGLTVTVPSPYGWLSEKGPVLGFIVCSEDCLPLHPSSIERSSLVKEIENLGP